MSFMNYPSDPAALSQCLAVLRSASFSCPIKVQLLQIFDYLLVALPNIFGYHGYFLDYQV